MKDLILALNPWITQVRVLNFTHLSERLNSGGVSPTEFKGWRVVTKEEFDYDEGLMHDLSNTLRQEIVLFSFWIIYGVISTANSRLDYVTAGYVVMLAPSWTCLVTFCTLLKWGCLRCCFHSVNVESAIYNFVSFLAFRKESCGNIVFVFTSVSRDVKLIFSAEKVFFFFFVRMEFQMSWRCRNLYVIALSFGCPVRIFALFWKQLSCNSRVCCKAAGRLTRHPSSSAVRGLEGGKVKTLHQTILAPRCQL